ncbi:hypothetical protein [Leptospira santarosai]|uniref:hypothetical protein n=1 Tax=Leptospira santarosai TaxID=28183 RepID=UPI0040363732
MPSYEAAFIFWAQRVKFFLTKQSNFILLQNFPEGLEAFLQERFELPQEAKKRVTSPWMAKCARKTPWSKVAHDVRLRNGKSELKGSSKL